MKNFDVYHPWKLSFVKANGMKLTDENNNQYLDFYGGHGVISIGHNHPVWTTAIQRRLETISYYSNAIEIKEQQQVASNLEGVSGLLNYQLFMCNSGAEANENAFKVASFHTGRSKILAFEKAFHGRTAGALSVTDNNSIVPAFGDSLNQTKIALNDEEALLHQLSTNEYAAVIIEGIQGVAGIFEATSSFWQLLRETCNATGTLLIADEIQSGCGRTGDFFAFQHHVIRPDIITMAKGIGNGFPVAAVWIDSKISAKKGQLGTTFGGSYLACSAVIAVLQTIHFEELMQNAKTIGNYLIHEISQLETVEEVRGRGLLLGIKTSIKAIELQKLLLEQGIVTGNSTCPFTLRILPPLSITKNEAKIFVERLSKILIQIEKIKIF